MRYKHLLALLLLALLIPIRTSAQSQRLSFAPDDAYADEYAYMYATTGSDSCLTVCGRFIEKARETGDKYLEGLADFAMIKHYRKIVHAVDEYSYIKEVSSLAENIRHLTRDDYQDFYFYAYFEEINFNLYRRRNVRALEIANSMHVDALAADNILGLYLCYRAFITISKARNSTVFSQLYLKKAIDLAIDYLPSESIVSMCMERAGTFAPGSDSCLFYLNLAEKHMKYDTDTTHVYREKAYHAAKIHDKPTFEKYKNLLAEFYEKQGKVIPIGAINILNMYEWEMNGDYAKADSVLNTYVNAKSKLNYIYDFSMARKDSARALDALIKLNHFSDSVNAAHSDLDILEMAARFGVDDYKNKVSEQEGVINKLERRNALLGFLVILILVILALALLLARQLVSIRSLKKANDMKTSFVQNMSHEIRTPLNSIVGFAQLLSLPDGFVDDEEKEEYAKHIVNNSNMLTMLIDDILNLSDIEGGNYKMNMDNASVNAMCDAAMNTVSYRVPAAVEMRRESELSDNYMVYTDAFRVQQVLINLLTNACKYTDKGEIVVGISLTENPGMVTFYVRDTGKGVPAEKAEAIFNRFEKLDNFVQGTGLGLNICRIIAENLNGKIYLDTKYTGGARFVFAIPTR